MRAKSVKITARKYGIIFMDDVRFSLLAEGQRLRVIATVPVPLMSHQRELVRFRWGTQTWRTIFPSLSLMPSTSVTT